LVHVQGSIQMIQAILLHIVIKLPSSSILISICSVASKSDVEIHFYIRVSAVVDCVEVVVLALVNAANHVTWEKSRLI
jgi:hypothetical protein